MSNKLLNVIFFLSCFLIHAQEKKENIFHNRDFWKNNPSVQTVKSKISLGNSPTQKDPFGFDAVSYGIIDNVSIKTIKFLLTIDGNHVTKPTHGNIPYLLWAAYKGNLPLINHLLDLGSDIHFETSKGTNVLLMCGFGGQKDTSLYEFLFSKGVDVNHANSDGMNILLTLAQSRLEDESIFKYLINTGLDWNYKDENNNGLFHYAAKAGNIKNMNLALNKGVDFKFVNKKGENAMFFATYGRRRSELMLNTFTFLDSLGLEVNIVNLNGQTPLHQVVKRGDSKVIDFFLKHGVDINKIDNNGNTAFMNSILGKHENIKKLFPLIEDINISNNEGHSAITNAVIYSKKEAFDFLISKGANLNVKDINNENLISLAFQNYSKRRKDNFEYIIDKLNAAGVIDNSQSLNGNTILHYAVKKNNIFLTKKALEMKINPNIKNKLGLTSLHLAAMKASDYEIINLLLNAGADKSILTNLGETSYDLANENEILISNNIDISSLRLSK